MDPTAVLLLLTGLGCATAGGVFYAFSTFALDGLDRLEAPEAVRAMQSVNVAAVRPALMLLLFGTGLACLAVLGTAVAGPGGDGGPGTGPVLGAVAYLLGTLGVTVVGNVPLNNRLAPARPRGDEAEQVWRSYSRPWRRWNHVRTVACLSAAVLLLAPG